MHRLRHRRRVVRALAEAKSLRARIRREWRWFLRDLRDLKAEIVHAQKLNAAIRPLPPERSARGHRR